LDADGLIYACATVSEERAARKAGLPAARVGLGAVMGAPPGRLVSFGLAGGLRDDLEPGDVLDVTRVVALDGTTLWQGPALGIRGARPATIVAGEGVLDGTDERRLLAERSGADAVDLESGPLARTGRLVGGVRVVSDTPSQPLGRLGGAVHADGSVRWSGLGAAFAHEPIATARAVGASLKALRSLERAAAEVR
jgi:hypothetical protein